MKQPNTIQQPSSRIPSDASNSSEFANQSPSSTIGKSPASPLDFPKRTSIEREVRELNDELGTLQRKCEARTIRIGKLLLELKEHTERGKWESYVEQQLGIPPRTASRYMNLWKRAREFGGIGEIFKPANLADLSVTELEDLLSRAEAGEATRPNKAPSQTKAKTPVETTPLRIADGSEVDLKRYGWKEGILSRQKLENWLRQPKQVNDHAIPRVRLERAVLQLAPSVNKTCGNADPTDARRLLDAAFSTLRDLLKESK